MKARSSGLEVVRQQQRGRCFTAEAKTKQRQHNAENVNEENEGEGEWEALQIAIHKLMIHLNLYSFPESHLLNNKTNMAKILRNAQPNLQTATHDIIPTVPQPIFILPDENAAFENHIRSLNIQLNATNNESTNHKSPPSAWIFKPDRGSRGNGITIISTSVLAAQFDKLIVADRRRRIAQRYVSNPLLLDGYKFDLRLYVLVTSFQPSFTAYLHPEGIARFCSLPYHDDDHRHDDGGRGGSDVETHHPPLRHISNTSIQSEAAVASVVEKMRINDVTCAAQNMMTMSALFSLLEARHFPRHVILPRILRLLQFVLQTFAPHMSVSTEEKKEGREEVGMKGAHVGFYGFDVLIDEEGEAWLLEINNLPDMKVTNHVHAAVKSTVLYDVIRLTMPPSVTELDRSLFSLSSFHSSFKSSSSSSSLLIDDSSSLLKSIDSSFPLPVLRSFIPIHSLSSQTSSSS